MRPHTYFWPHHAKFVVIDETFAFIGGTDLPTAGTRIGRVCPNVRKFYARKSGLVEAEYLEVLGTGLLGYGKRNPIQNAYLKLIEQSENTLFILRENQFFITATVSERKLRL
nr:CFF_HP1_G0031290.mRNA.1.CDS.1 [Saccharomyces cerevisiae]